MPLEIASAQSPQRSWMQEMFNYPGDITGSIATTKPAERQAMEKAAAAKEATGADKAAPPPEPAGRACVNVPASELDLVWNHIAICLVAGSRCSYNVSPLQPQRAFPRRAMMRAGEKARHNASSQVNLASRCFLSVCSRRARRWFRRRNRQL